MQKKNIVSRLTEQFNDQYSDSNIQIYNPLKSHSIIKNIIPTMTTQQPMPSSKTLFETKDQDTNPQIDPLINSQKSLTTIPGQKNNQSFCKLFQSKTEANIQKSIENDKDETLSDQCCSGNFQTQFPFGRSVRIKNPQIPQFQKLSKDNFSEFIKRFAKKFQYFQSTKMVSNKIPAVEVTCSPLDFFGRAYKFYMGLAQTFKKQQGICESLMFYCIAIYLQPLDQVVWDFYSKLNMQVGCFKTGLKLLETGIIWTQSEILLEKYLKYLDKGLQNVDRFSAVGNMILDVCDRKVQKFMKHFIELSNLYYKNFDQITSIRILFFLYNKFENCHSLILDISKTLELQNNISFLLQLLRQYIQRNSGKHSLVYILYIKYLEHIENPQIVLNQLLFVEQKVEVACVKESKSRVFVELADAYKRIGEMQKNKEYLKKAFDHSKQPYRYKIYFLICSQSGHGHLLPNLRNPYVVLQANKRNFIISSKTQPIMYNFNQWKYCLHYSLFYIFNGHQQSYNIIVRYSQYKESVGRIHSELIWIQRIQLKTDLAIKRWQACILSMPKSGQIWCEGGRIMMNQGNIQKALRYFKIAVELTPQYGDSFIQLLNIYMLQGNYKQIKKLKKKMILSQPNYGSLWCFLKINQRSSISDIWRKAKSSIQKQIYRWNIKYLQKIMQKTFLTAIEEFNEIFFRQKNYINSKEREKLYSLYDQLQ